jgi:hypothetical protein
VALRRLSGGVYLQVVISIIVISIISEICLQHIHNFIIVHFISQHEIGEKKINKNQDFINVIGNRLIAESGDSKSKKFLFERISLAIQRGNAASIRGTFPDSAILSEIFVL